MKVVLSSFVAMLAATFSVEFLGIASVAYRDASHRCFPELPPSDNCRKATDARNYSAAFAFIGASVLGITLTLRARQKSAGRQVE